MKKILEIFNEYFLDLFFYVTSNGALRKPVLLKWIKCIGVDCINFYPGDHTLNQNYELNNFFLQNSNFLEV